MPLRNAASQSKHRIGHPRAATKTKKAWKATSDTVGASVFCSPTLGARCPGSTMRAFAWSSGSLALLV
eukprot:1678976-Alexandrium_andersonii.AAC.1